MFWNWNIFKKKEKKILLMGFKGYLGSYLAEKLRRSNHNVYYFGNKDLNRLPDDSFDYIINCIANVNVKVCQENKKLSYNANVKPLEYVLDKYPTAKIIHFSSYYVYDDLEPCNELSNTIDTFTYAKHKMQGEGILLHPTNGIGKERPKHLILRLGKLFGNPYQEDKKLTGSFLKSKNKFSADNKRFNPCSTEQVWRAIDYELDKRKLEGIYNLANLGCPDSHGYCNVINSFLKKEDRKEINLDKSRENQYNIGRQRNFMSLSKIQKHIKLVDYYDDMREYIKKVKYNGEEFEVEFLQ